MTGNATNKSNQQVVLLGSCHCGAVKFEAKSQQTIKIIECNCSICSMTGFRHLIIKHSDFKLTQGKEALSEYRFGTATARHLFCMRCGIKSFYQPRSHPDSYSVNFNCVLNQDAFSIETVSFDGKNWEQSIGSLKD